MAHIRNPATVIGEGVNSEEHGCGQLETVSDIRTCWSHLLSLERACIMQPESHYTGILIKMRAGSIFAA